MKSGKKELLARAGIATKGIIYLLIGGLTAYATWFNGNAAKDSGGVLQYIAQQTLGQVMLVCITVGICGYVFWRLYLAIFNPKDQTDSDKKSTIKRLGYFFSALSYTLLAFTGIQILMGSNSQESTKQGWIAFILEQPAGVYLIYAIALLLLIKAIYEIYRVYSGKFKSKIRDTELDEKAQATLIKCGSAGFIARGIVIAVIAFLFFKAGQQSNENMAGGTKMAFTFLQQQGGTIALGIIATGLALYGIFMMASSRYRYMPL